MKTRPSAMASLLQISGLALLCALVGLTIGVGVTIHATEVRLDRYATHLLQFAEGYNAEINSILDQVNASPFPFCSDADIARHHVGDMQLGSLADQRTGLIEWEVTGQDLEGIGHHRIGGKIDAGKQTLLHLLPVLLGERVGHIRADLNIELHYFLPFCFWAIYRPCVARTLTPGFFWTPLRRGQTFTSVHGTPSGVHQCSRK